MTLPSREAVPPEPEPRATCYRCFKPQVLCLCTAIPRVDNRTQVVVLQHPRERFHPLGTARIALQGLARVSREIGERRGRRCVVERPALPPATGLLYPSESARELTSLAPGERPEALVVLDGTWSQAKSLYDDNAWLETLPHYRLSPEAPSRYRIRRQPERHCLSTIESIADALAQLEPETRGLEGLVGALDEMIERQVTHRPEESAVPRFKRPRQRGPRHVPEVLVEEPERIVVVYGEAVQCEGPRNGRIASLLQWTALRPFAAGDDASPFEALIQPATPPRPGYLACLDFGAQRTPQPASEARTEAPVGESSAVAWPGGCTLPEFAERWRSYLRPQDVLAPWNHTALRLLSHALESAGAAAPHPAHPSIRLKESYCNVRGGPCGSLLEVADRESLTPTPLDLHGRARRRLAATAALARWLRTWANDH